MSTYLKSICKSLAQISTHIIISSIATAATAAPIERQWTKEPQKVFGLTLGSTIEELGLVECAYGTSSPEQLCLGRPLDPQRQLVALFGAPDLGFEYQLFTVIREESVAQLVLTGDNRSWSTVKSILIERYGFPTQESVERFTTKLGSKFSSEKISWIGKRIRINANERSGSADRFLVVFSSEEHSLNRYFEDKAKIRDAATKF